MENFDVHVISKNIINGLPIATCVVTYDNVFLAAVKYNYFSQQTDLPYFDPSRCIPLEEFTFPRITELKDQVQLAVLQHISSDLHSYTNRVSDELATKKY